MFILVPYMYIRVYPSNMVCLAGQLQKINWLCALCALTSIFSSPPKLSLQINLPPPYPYLMDLNPLQSGWSTYTGLLILCCVGCQPIWQSGLVRMCRMSWGFLTKLTREQSVAVVGPLVS